jgi:hypothetical protein
MVLDIKRNSGYLYISETSSTSERHDPGKKADIISQTKHRRAQAPVRADGDVVPVGNQPVYH